MCKRMTEACGQRKQSHDPHNNQHNPQYANYWALLTRKRHIPPHPAQPRHTNDGAPRTRKRHQQEHRPQRPTERSDPTQHAKGRPGDCPGPRKGTTTRRNVTRGGGGGGVDRIRSRRWGSWGGRLKLDLPHGRDPPTPSRPVGRGVSGGVPQRTPVGKWLRGLGVGGGGWGCPPGPPRGCAPRTPGHPQRCLGWRGGGTPPLEPAPPPLSRAPSLCPATVSLTPSAGLNGICNRQ